jgi:hypothetical protein
MLIKSLEKSFIFEKAALGLAGKVLKSISGKDFKVVDVEDDLNFPILTIRDSEFFRFSWLGESEDGLEKIDDLGLSLILTYSSKSMDIPTIIPDFEFDEEKDQFDEFQNILRKFGFNEPSSYIYSFSDSLTESVEALRTNYSITNLEKDSIKFKTRSRWITRITKIEEDMAVVIGDSLVVGVTEIYDSRDKIIKRTVTLYSSSDEDEDDLKPSITILQDITSLRIANDYELDLFYKISRWKKSLNLPRRTAIEIDTVTGNLKEPEKYTPSEKPLKS